MDLREVQSRLKALGLFAGRIGDPANTKATDDAMMAFFRSQRVSGWDHWGSARRVIAAGQLLCRVDGIDAGEIDGLIGPQTRYAFDVYDSRRATGQIPSPEETWRDPPLSVLPRAAKPPPAATAWPKQSGVSKVFGAVGTNQVTLTFPYPMRLAWDLKTTVSRTSCHKLVLPSFRRVFERTLDHYGIDEIRRLRLDLFGGCLNVRRMRGGSSWSMHSWGIAFDIDPEHNQLRWGRDRASLAKPAYEPFWGFVEDEGLVSLGRARNYDWMHFQAARV